MTTELDVRMALVEQRQDQFEKQAKEMEKVIKNNTQAMNELKEEMAKRNAVLNFCVKLIGLIGVCIGIIKGLPLIFHK